MLTSIVHSRLLVVGGSGFLGSYVMQYCRQANIDAIGTAKGRHDGNLQSLDITDLQDAKKVIEKVKPTCVINCAAMTNVDECERQLEKARGINALGPGNLAEVCNVNDIRLVHVSTDSVFDGNEGGYSETSQPDPVNAYALTKLEGERSASLCRNHVVVRTNLYGLNPLGKGLLNWILAGISNGKEITGFVDVVFNPLWACDLAESLVKLSEMQYTGIMNCAGSEVFSKYEFARQVAYRLGYDGAKVKEGTSSSGGALVAKRPKNTTLKNDRMRELLNTKIHTLEEVLHGPDFDVYRSKEAKKV